MGWSAGTLKFPSTFKTGKREIWVDGEIYIEVEKNKAHPFYETENGEIVPTEMGVRCVNVREITMRILIRSGFAGVSRHPYTQGNDPAKLLLQDRCMYLQPDAGNESG